MNTTKKPLLIFILSLALLSLFGGCSQKAAYQLYELDFDPSQHQPDDIQILAMGNDRLLYGVSRILYNETGLGYGTILGAYSYTYDGRHIPLMEADKRNSYPNYSFYSGLIGSENYAFSLITPITGTDYYYTIVFAGDAEGTANSIYQGKSYINHLPNFIYLNNKIYFIASKESKSIILYDIEAKSGGEMQLNYDDKEFRLLSTEGISSNNKEILLFLENGGKGYYGIHNGTELTLVWPTESNALIIEQSDSLQPIVLQHVWLTPEERIEAAAIPLPADLSIERLSIFPTEGKAFGLHFIEDERFFLYTDQKPANNILLRKATAAASRPGTGTRDHLPPNLSPILPPSQPTLPPVQKTKKIIEGYEADHILYQDSYTSSGILFFNTRFIPEFGEMNQGTAFIDHEKNQLDINIGVTVFSLGKHNIQPTLAYAVSLDTCEILSKEIIPSGVPEEDGGLKALSNEKLASIARLCEELIHKGADLYGQEYNQKIEYTNDSINQLSYYSDKRLLSYALNADGAFAESSSYELYTRFLTSPFTLLEEVSKLMPEDRRHVLNILCYYPRNYDLQEEFDPVLDRVNIGDTIMLLREVYENGGRPRD